MTELESQSLVVADRLEWLGDPWDHGTVIDVTPHHVRIKWDGDNGITLMHRSELMQLTLVKD